ncbi:hypothetical protein [Streptomyces sp. NPDC088748]|uniref:hypothetical protein n=1 Tax=Streptomyces sp. NPDC088748 TaxID=3365887 RepID=UPI00381CFE15
MTITQVIGTTRPLLAERDCNVRRLRLGTLDEVIGHIGTDGPIEITDASRAGELINKKSCIKFMEGPAKKAHYRSA